MEFNTIVSEQLPSSNAEDSDGIVDASLNGKEWLKAYYRGRNNAKNQETQHQDKPALAITLKRGTAPNTPRLPSIQDYKFKIVIKPRQPITLKALENVLGKTIISALRSPPRERIKFRLLEEQNIIIACTNNTEDAFELEELKKIPTPKGDLEVEAYLTLPTETCKGIIHGVEPHFTNSEIAENTYADGLEILSARRLGRSNTAIIIFPGKKVPFTVTFESMEKRCFIYMKTHAACLNCGKAGHRVDVCPKPKGYACSNCGTPNPTDGHLCTPLCALCGGPHRTYAKECTMKFYRPDRPASSTKRKNRSHSRSRARRTQEQQQVRWSREEHGSRSQSRSRASSVERRSTSRGRGKGKPLPPTLRPATSAWNGSLENRREPARQGPPDNERHHAQRRCTATPNMDLANQDRWPSLPSALNGQEPSYRDNAETQALRQEIQRLRSENEALRRATLRTQKEEKTMETTPSPPSQEETSQQRETHPALGDRYHQVMQEIRACREETHQYVAQVIALQQGIQQLQQHQAGFQNILTRMMEQMPGITKPVDLPEKRKRRKSNKSAQEDCFSDTDSSCVNVAS